MHTWSICGDHGAVLPSFRSMSQAWRCRHPFRDRLHDSQAPALAPSSPQSPAWRHWAWPQQPAHAGLWFRSGAAAKRIEAVGVIQWIHDQPGVCDPTDGFKPDRGHYDGEYMSVSRRRAAAVAVSCQVWDYPAWMACQPPGLAIRWLGLPFQCRCRH